MTPERLARLDGVLNRRQPDLAILAENLHKPRNLSAVVRTCDAVGIPEVHIVPGKDRPRRHWHTSQGAEKWVTPVIHDDIDSACASLKSDGFTILGAHLSDRAVDYRDVDYTVPTALLLGTEAFGVTDDALARVDTEIVIPMMGMSQSLNVSVACAVVLYEALAQRRAAGLYESSRMAPAKHRKTRFEWLHPTLARWCRDHDVAYPAINADGDLLEDPRKRSKR
ncbi:tRNA (guanosine(18)-2'-O)-methyltransferase TrmH [Marinihelvus fidelis]|uniref:tRNA (guanosine(18)-2'-O)-methyltransferase n=1 Tax=Marinihelvus fidelis TaxID=2613842 RepID=A0A5N0TBW3_9GAMM|nr:tRNA (guanosine(18)-2'-O)-methyltransferase TrmH [Marinihelvus fidelis]KAA9131316.1 tRNA (guanosine(18)-2'-O)-methyltransferase TrmH [Marinihelvus fidelis]